MSSHIFRKVSGVFQRNFNGSKIVLSSSQRQGNFRGLEALRPRPRTSKCGHDDVLDAKDVLEDSTSRNRHQTRETKPLKHNMRGTSLSSLSIIDLTYFELASHSFCDVILCNCVIPHGARERENKRNKALRR